MDFTTANAIQLKFVQEEWLFLESMSQEKGGNNFRDYLNNRLHQLARNIIVSENKPDCGECNSRRNFYIPPDISNEITFLADFFCISVAELTRRLIVNPLLKDHFDKGVVGLFK